MTLNFVSFEGLRGAVDRNNNDTIEIGELADFRGEYAQHHEAEVELRAVPLP